MILPVQKRVPVPKIIRPQGGRARKYPFETMDVGEMFFIPNKIRNTMSTHASTVGKKLGKRFTTRLTTMVETSTGWKPCDPDYAGAVIGIGVWRVE
jgi:hypothetical protein